MQSGDLIYIDFVGRVKDTGEIFDVTIEDAAKKGNVYNPKTKYKPVPVVIDGDFVIKGLNETLKEMKVDEKKTIEVTPEKAFGERKPDLIKLIPLSSFDNQNIDATPGSFVTVNGMGGRIVTVSGGRVRVDFNHPLAGKNLEYEVEIKSEVKEVDGKIRGIVEYFTNLEKDQIDITVSTIEVQIIAKTDILKNVKQSIADTVLKWVKEIQKVKFVDVFEKSS